MKFKNITGATIMIASIFLYFSPMAKAAPFCTEGKIEYFQYNNSDNVVIRVEPYNLYTSKDALKPLLFIAFLLRTKVQIQTEYCSDGGGFNNVVFRNK